MTPTLWQLTSRPQALKDTNPSCRARGGRRQARQISSISLQPQPRVAGWRTSVYGGLVSASRAPSDCWPPFASMPRSKCVATPPWRSAPSLRQPCSVAAGTQAQVQVPQAGEGYHLPRYCFHRQQDMRRLQDSGSENTGRARSCTRHGCLRQHRDTDEATDTQQRTSFADR